MTPEQWQIAWRVFETACRLPEADRKASIEAACDPETAAEVFQMLANLEGIVENDPPESLQEAEASDWPLLGVTIGRYRVTGIVGRGGMGEVYSADDTELSRRVALKVVSNSSAGSSGSADRFIREARAASALNHPNIVTVHEVIRAGSSFAIVMELVDGEPLRAMCGEAQPVELVALWGRQIAEGLAAAHARGIVHRDIKPENVILRRDGYIKVLDFGLAREMANATPASNAGLPPGTFRYMSPEQVSGEEVTGSTDVFSLGLVLYELATGRHPFEAKSPLVVAHNIVSQRAPAPSELNSAIPAAFDSLLSTMLDKDAAKRPDAAEVARRLAGPWQGAAPVRRWKKKTIAGVIVAAAAVAAVAISLWLWRLGETVIDARRVAIAPFTTFEGSETQPAFSPDGSEIAFVWTGESGKNLDVYVKRIDGGGLRRLTSDPAEDLHPCFSPDGKQIAFLRQTEGSNGPEVMVMAADGTEPRSLGRVYPLFGFYGLTWSPDGQSLVARDSDGGNVALFRLSLTDGSRTRLTNPPKSEADGHPLFSPDGKWLAFMRYQASGARICFRTAADAPGVREQCPVESWLTDFAWTADSRRVLYAGQSGLWLSSMSGNPRPAQVLAGSFAGFTVDRAGRQFAFTRSYIDANIWRISNDGKDNTRLIASSGEDSAPDWSRDGKRIVVRSNRSGSYELYTYAADGSGENRITDFGGHIDNPRWSPDGEWIAFDGNRARTDALVKHHNIYIVRSSGGPLRRMTDDVVHYDQPSWSNDGRWIYYLKEARPGETWKVPVDGGSPILMDSLELQDLTESPDGQFLYYVKYADSSGVRRRPLAGGKEETLTPTEGVRLFRYWSLSRDGIVFVTGPNDPVLRFLNLHTQKVTRIADIPSKLIKGPRGLAVSPDGHSILYTLEDVNASDIMLGTLK